jgi:hypothetical protein
VDLMAGLIEWADRRYSDIHRRVPALTARGGMYRVRLFGTLHSPSEWESSVPKLSRPIVRSTMWQVALVSKWR